MGGGNGPAASLGPRVHSRLHRFQRFAYPIMSFAANRMAIDSLALSKDILQSPCESAEMSKHGEKIRCWSLVGSSRIERAAVWWLPRAR